MIKLSSKSKFTIRILKESINENYKSINKGGEYDIIELKSRPSIEEVILCQDNR